MGIKPHIILTVDKLFMAPIRIALGKSNLSISVTAIVFLSAHVPFLCYNKCFPFSLCFYRFVLNNFFDWKKFKALIILQTKN